MLKVQFVNAYTQDILREDEYESLEKIENMITDFERVNQQGLEIFILDNRQRTLESKYVSHSILKVGRSKVHRMFFTTKLAPIQAKIRD